MDQPWLRVCFGRFELDEATRELRADGVPIEVQAQPLALLLLLARNRHRVVRREEILEALWPGVTVSDDALWRTVLKARKALGEVGTTERWLRTVRGVGFRFMAPVEEDRPRQGANSAPSPVATVTAALGPASFVGRERERARLDEAWRAVLAGSGRVVLISGTAGIGKSRLAREIAAEARAQGAEVREAVSWHGKGEPPLWLWTQILRSFVESWSAADLARAMGPGAAEIARLAPTLVEKLGITAPPVRDGDEARFLQMDAVARFLVQASRERPQVLVLEDLQWAPPAALHLLGFLARELGHSHVLVVATLRTGEAREDPALEDALDDCEQADVLIRVPLSGLDADALGRLIEQTAGFVPNGELVEALCATTGGNPFFVKQIVTLASTEGRGEGVDAVRLATHVRSLPLGARRVLERRLALLPAGCRRVIELASVIGGEFPLALLARVAALPREELMLALGEAVAAGLLEADPRRPGDHRFVHALVRDAAYANLPEPARLQLHQQVAEAIEALHEGRLERVASSLAHHFAEAAPLLRDKRASDYSKWAGDLASAALSYEEAVAHYERALQTFDQLEESLDVRRRAELLVCVGYAHHNTGASGRAREALGQAAGLALRAGDRGLLALAAAGFAEIGLGVEDAEPVRYLEAALAMLEPGCDFIHVWLRSILVVHLMNHRGRLGDAARLAEEAVIMARTTGDARSLCYALCALAAVLRLLPTGRPEERVKILREVEARSAESGDRSIEVIGYIQLRGALIELGDLASAAATNARMDRLLERLRSRYFVAVPDGFRLARSLLDGRFEDAEAIIRSSLPTPDGPRGAFSMAAAALAGTRWSQGRLAELAPVFARVAAGRPNLQQATAGQILMLLEQGETSEARARFEALAHRDFEEVLGTESFLFTLAILAEACVRIEDVPRARVLARLLAPYDRYFVTASNGFYVHGPVALHLGRLSVCMGAWDDAARYLEQALERAEAVDSIVWRAFALGLRAQLYAARSAPGDRSRARSDASEARAIAERLGLQGLVRELEGIR